MCREKADTEFRYGDMSEAIDLKKILASWPYDPENDARVARVAGGREVLQVRTPLGLEQLELDGRPDGVRPHLRESVLEFHLARYEQAKITGQEGDFDLSAADCAELFNEGTLYYLRYVRLFQLRDWPRTVRDTARNLRVFDFVHEHARREEDRMFLEKWRPYIVRVNASAAAMQQIEKSAFQRAQTITQEAIDRIEALEGVVDDETFAFERDRSVQALRELLAQIQKNRPLSEVEQLERQLGRAVERQEFERAALLRDKIRDLKKQQVAT
jgi:hypothetical protein